MPAVFQSQQIKHRVSGRVLFELSGAASVKACVEALLAALEAPAVALPGKLTGNGGTDF